MWGILCFVFLDLTKAFHTMDHGILLLISFQRLVYVRTCFCGFTLTSLTGNRAHVVTS